MVEPAPGPLRCRAARVMAPDDWPGELGATWTEACEAAGLDPAGPELRSKKRVTRGRGYGLVLCQDSAGSFWTVVTSDPDSISRWWPGDNLTGYQPKPRQILDTRRGWLAYRWAGAEAPSPPPSTKTSLWALPVLNTVAARRRSLADQIAGEIQYRRPLPFDEYLMAWREEEANYGITDPDPPEPRLIDLCQLVDADHPSAIPEALATLADLAQGRQPDDAIHSETGSYETARPAPAAPSHGLERRLSTTPNRRAERLLRVTTDSISLVARTDGPVILLLDEAPGRLFQVPHDHPNVVALLNDLRSVTDHG